MKLTDKQMEILNKANDDALTLFESHSLSTFQTKISLLTNLFYLSLSLSSIALAFQAIVIATNVERIESFFIVSVVNSILLLFYSVSFVREQIDNKDKELNQGMESLDSAVKKTRDKIRQTIKEDNFNVWVDHISSVIKKNGDKEKPSLNYSGEVSLFLFTNSILFGILAVLNVTNNELLLFFMVPVFSFLISFFEWNTTITGKISSFLDRLLR